MKQVLKKSLISLFEDLMTFLWYIRRPKLYSALIDLILRSFFLTNKDNDQNKSNALNWCEEKCTSKNQFYLELGLSHPISFNDIAGEDYFKRLNSRIVLSNSNFGGPGDVDLLYNLVEFFEFNNVVETGVAYGFSSSAILHSLKKRDGKLISIDMPMPKQSDYHLIGTAVCKEHLPLWTLIKEPDKTGLLRAIKKLNEIDLFHYDSDKNYYGREFAFPLMLKALKKGGFLISDDIEDNLHFKEFVEVNDLQYWVTKIDGKYVGIIRK